MVDTMIPSNNRKLHEGRYGTIKKPNQPNKQQQQQQQQQIPST